VTGRQQTIRIRSQSDIHTSVFTVQELAKDIGMNTGSIAAIATAVSELVTNVVKYANFGRITFQEKKRLGRPGIEVLVEDHGPGIVELDVAMSDNVSTGGTLGLGLPGAKRLVDEFQIDSKPNEGTRVRVVKWG
jgi:serine/threonine-protein kinase RsbT